MYTVYVVNVVHYVKVCHRLKGESNAEKVYIIKVVQNVMLYHKITGEPQRFRCF